MSVRGQEDIMELIAALIFIILLLDLFFFGIIVIDEPLLERLVNALAG